jgi:hypothetical protein
MLGNASKSSWTPFEQYLKGIGNFWEMLGEYFSATITDYRKAELSRSLPELPG